MTATIGSFLVNHPTFDRSLRDFSRRGALDFDGFSNMQLHQQLAVRWAVLEIPERFFDRDVHRDVAALLTATRGAQIDPDIAGAVVHALHLLRRANRLNGDPAGNWRRSEEEEHWLRETVFPEYIRIAEHIFTPLLGLLVQLEIVRGARQKQVGGTLHERLDQAIAYGLPPSILKPYRRIVRNSITHGGLSFDAYEVTFTDRNAQCRLPREDVRRLVTRLLDACNAIAATLAWQEVTHGTLPFLQEWVRCEQVLGFGRTSWHDPHSCQTSTDAHGYRVDIHGAHLHWDWNEMFADSARLFIAAKHIFPAAKAVFTSFVGPRGASSACFVRTEAIPSLDAPLSELGSLAKAMAEGGLHTLEHERLVTELLSSHGGIFGSIAHWLHDQDFPMQRNAPPFEIRELRDISIGWRSRFDARIVSVPRREDLTTDGQPTVGYLNRLFWPVAARFVVRDRGRPFGAGRLRIPTAGIITVYDEDARLAELQSVGLDLPLLFRFQLAFQLPRAMPFLGGHVATVGPYKVSLNPNAQEKLAAIAAATTATT